MACRGFFECVLKLLNLIVMAVGLAMVGYGAYLLVMWLQAAPLPPPSPSPVAVSPSADLVELGWPLLLLVVDASLPDGTAERLSSAWNRHRQIVRLKRVALYSHLLGLMESMRSPKIRSTGFASMRIVSANVIMSLQLIALCANDLSYWKLRYHNYLESSYHFLIGDIADHVVPAQELWWTLCSCAISTSCIPIRNLAYVFSVPCNIYVVFVIDLKNRLPVRLT